MEVIIDDILRKLLITKFYTPFAKAFAGLKYIKEQNSGVKNVENSNKLLCAFPYKSRRRHTFFLVSLKKYSF